MKVLITKSNQHEREELQEFFQNQSLDPFFAEEPKTMYQMLSQYEFDAVLYNVNNTDDFAAIRYINLNYPNTRVIVTTNDRLVTTIGIIRAGKFTVVGKFDDIYQLEKLFPEPDCVCPYEINTTTNENYEIIKRTKRVKEKS